MISTPEERALYDEWVKAWNAYKDGIVKVMEVSRKEAGKIPHDSYALSKDYIKIARAADDILQKDIDLNNKGADDDTHAAASSYNFAFWLILGILAGSVVVGAAISFFVIRDVISGIASIVKPMQSLGAGDLSADVPHRGEKTEIGTMADALQIFKDALVAKKAADEAAARDAEQKIERGRRVDAITREFESMIGEVVQTVSSASTQLEASATTLSSTAERSQELATAVAAASEEASTNVQSVASATEELSSSVNEISRQVQELARMASEAVGQARTHHRARQRAVEGRDPHRRRRRADQHHRGPDQPARAQRHHRGGARGRSRPRLCGGCVRSEGACRADREGDRRDRPADFRHPGGDAGVRSARSRRSPAPSSGCRKSRRRSRPPSKSRARRRRKSPATSSRPRRAPSRSPPTSPTSSAAPPRPARRPRRCCRRRSRCRRLRPPQGRGLEVPHRRARGDQSSRVLRAGRAAHRER